MNTYSALPVAASGLPFNAAAAIAPRMLARSAWAEWIRWFRDKIPAGREWEMPLKVDITLHMADWNLDVQSDYRFKDLPTLRSEQTGRMTAAWSLTLPTWWPATRQ
jgi:hypothetical protein